MNFVGGGRIVKTFVLAAIRFYQAALSPMNPWGCKYWPSCSHYALEAIERHGLRHGVALALRRLLRCHPFVFGGYDPVPESREAAR
jgi:putative membrane protein insertion efficiency factor